MQATAELTLTAFQQADVALLAALPWRRRRFMSRRAVEGCLARMELPPGSPEGGDAGRFWPLPLTLDVPEATALRLLRKEGPGAAASLALRDCEGLLVGTVRVDDVWQADAASEVRALFEGRRRPEDSCVQHIMGLHPWRVSGDVVVAASSALPPSFAAVPTVAHFTRRPLTVGAARALADLTASAAASAALVAVCTAPSVCDDEVDAAAALRSATLAVRTDERLRQIRCCSAKAVPFPASRGCGPRETLLTCAIAAELGFKRVLFTPQQQAASSASDFAAAQVLAKRMAPHLGATVPVFADGVEVEPPGIFARLRAGDVCDRDWAGGHRAAAALRRAYPPRARQGFVVLLTGLSSSGKSTLAKALCERLRAEDAAARRVTVLDGDVVRRHLSKGLGFSRQDRDENVLRIGFAGSLVARSGGVAILAPIAPYADTRRRVRDLCLREGSAGFVEVHVATPLAECERRDAKGLYAKARAGKLPHFTGIDDPYEAPQHAEVVVDTSNRTVPDCVESIFRTLVAKGLVDISDSL